MTGVCLLQLLNADDVSGLRVTSSERVAVVVRMDSDNDQVMTQLPAVNHWHNHYLQAPAAHRFRVLGITDHTIIVVSLS